MDCDTGMLMRHARACSRVLQLKTTVASIKDHDIVIVLTVIVLVYIVLRLSLSNVWGGGLQCHYNVDDNNNAITA